MQSELQYTRVRLNRADDLRRSKDKVDALWHHANTTVVPLHNRGSLFNSAFDPVFANQSALQAHEFEFLHKSLLGLDDDNSAWFSVQCSDKDASKWRAIYPDTEFHDLRTAGATLDPDVASVLAYARGLSHWQSVNLYCSKCGGENQPNSAGHSMRCLKCQSEVFPRTDPAVIMLVEHKDQHGNKKCLLGRNPAWPVGCYSTLAGFVETGESLEAAVIREVFEESGVVVENPQYVASQPWPFPQSIMLGFVADAVSSDIVLDKLELENADWFSADEISQFGEWADAGDGLKMPRIDSIARYLIDSWIAKQNLAL